MHKVYLHIYNRYDEVHIQYAAPFTSIHLHILACTYKYTYTHTHALYVQTKRMHSTLRINLK